MCVQRRPYRKGDRVQMSDNLLQMMELQQGHGGWIPEMQSVCSLIICVAVCLSICLSNVVFWLYTTEGHSKP